MLRRATLPIRAAEPTLESAQSCLIADRNEYYCGKRDSFHRRGIRHHPSPFAMGLACCGRVDRQRNILGNSDCSPSLGIPFAGRRPMKTPKRKTIAKRQLIKTGKDKRYV